YKNRIKDWPENERPRERLFQYGVGALSDAELLGIVLQTGSHRQTATDLARRLLIDFNSLRGLDAASIADLCHEPGIGLAKASQIKAAFELAKRLVQQKWKTNTIISNSEDVYHYMHLRMRDLSREEFKVLFLTTRNEIIGEKTLFEGSLTESVVSPREVIINALQLNAAHVILMHNHPSGNSAPSPEDKRVTEKIAKACTFADIHVLDHMIFGKDSYFSFADSGLIKDG
ncbi:MAG: JAB domain-containing protein, partial [Calditrichaeota bacterium]